MRNTKNWRKDLADTTTVQIERVLIAVACPKSLYHAEQPQQALEGEIRS